MVQKAYVKGITRQFDDLVQAMGMSGISKSQCHGCDGDRQAGREVPRFRHLVF